MLRDRMTSNSSAIMLGSLDWMEYRLASFVRQGGNTTKALKKLGDVPNADHLSQKPCDFH
jgi:hypothetical protein